MAVKETVENAISEHTITIFSKTYCPYCTKAKKLIFADYPDIKVHVSELDKLDNGAAIQQYLLEKTGQTTVPNIFINTKHVGGCSDVVDLKQNGSLDGLVRAKPEGAYDSDA